MRRRRFHGEYYFNQMRLHRVLLFASLLFLVGTILVIRQDHQREWRVYQREFRVLQRAEEKRRVSRELAIAEAELGAIEQSTSATAGSAGVQGSGAPGREARDLQVRVEAQRQASQLAKSRADAARYRLTQLSSEGTSQATVLAEMQQQYAQLQARSTKESDRLQELEAELSVLPGGDGNSNSPDTQLAASLTRAREKVQRLRSQLDKSEDSSTARVVETVRNLPLINFITPTEKVEQVIAKEVNQDLHFSSVPRAERCITCHVGIDKKGFESADQPLRTHPRLDLFVGDNSKHPMDQMACTICHGGNGHAVDFKHAAHTPRSAEQGIEWQELYDWKPEDAAQRALLPLQYTQANCAACHQSAYEIPTASKLLQGQVLFENLNCAGCHQLNRLEGTSGVRKIGYDLSVVGAKLQKNWTLKFVDDPTAWHPDSRMPRSFHLPNTDDEVTSAKESVLVNAITEYLFSRATSVTLEQPPATGNATAGADLIRSVGCAACHRITPLGLMDAGIGPDLSNAGSKLSKKWIFNWVRNPQHYFADTVMPELRLSTVEANDIAEYLGSLRGEIGYLSNEGTSATTSFETRSLPPYDPAAERELFQDLLRGQASSAEIDSRYQKMSPAQRLLFLGEKGISRQGCYGCHSIPGFEGAAANGAEISEIGAKSVHDFDFGLQGATGSGQPGNIPRTRHDWLTAKLENTRIFDDGKVLNYTERLKMPQYNLAAPEIEALVTYMLGLATRSVSQKMLITQDDDGKLLTKGRETLQKYNCTSCHQMGLWPTEVPVASTDFQGKLLWRRRDLSVPLQLENGLTSDILALRAHDFVRGDVTLPNDGESTGIIDLLLNAGITEVEALGSDEGRIQKLYAAANFAPPLLRLEGERVQYTWLLDFLKNPFSLRPQLNIRMPRFPWRGREAEATVAFFAVNSGQPWPMDNEQTSFTKEQAAAGRELLGIRGTPEYSNSMQCAQCHPTGTTLPPNDRVQWGPNLAMSQHRLKQKWIYGWLYDPQYYIPGTAMPSFFYDTGSTPPTPLVPDARGKMDAIVAHLLTMNAPEEEWRDWWIRADSSTSTGTATSEFTTPTVAISAP